jgi:hypothetical protein
MPVFNEAPGFSRGEHVTRVRRCEGSDVPGKAQALGRVAVEFDNNANAVP